MKSFELFSKVVLDSVSPSVFIFGTVATGEMAVMLSLPWGLLGRVCDWPLPCSVNYRDAFVPPSYLPCPLGLPWSYATGMWPCAEGQFACSLPEVFPPVLTGSPAPGTE